MAWDIRIVCWICLLCMFQNNNNNNHNKIFIFLMFKLCYHHKSGHTISCVVKCNVQQWKKYVGHIEKCERARISVWVRMWWNIVYFIFSSSSLKAIQNSRCVMNGFMALWIQIKSANRSIQKERKKRNRKNAKIVCSNMRRQQASDYWF